MLNFIQWDGDPRPFWLSTSSNDLVRRLLEQRGPELEPSFEALLEGGSIERVLDEHVSLGELDRNEDALWSLLVFSGYLKAEKRSRGPGEMASHLLSIPNREVRLLYAGTFRQWLSARMTGHGGSIDKLRRALCGGDAELLEEQLQALTTNVLLYHEVGGADPERVYQGFVLSLLTTLEPDYQVRSNRESGKGRPDVMIRPARPGLPGVVLELKVARAPRRTLEQALELGLRQIRENDYAAELRAAGATPVHAFAVALDGKTVRVAGYCVP